MEVPLGDTHNVMVTPEYVRYLVKVANDKMEANRKRTERFFEILKSNGSVIADDYSRLSLANEACDHLELDDESQLQNGNAATSTGQLSF